MAWKWGNISSLLRQARDSAGNLALLHRETKLAAHQSDALYEKLRVACQSNVAASQDVASLWSEMACCVL